MKVTAITSVSQAPLHTNRTSPVSVAFNDILETQMRHFSAQQSASTTLNHHEDVQEEQCCNPVCGSPLQGTTLIEWVLLEIAMSDAEASENALLPPGFIAQYYQTH